MTDAPERTPWESIWYNPTTGYTFRSSEHGFVEYVLASEVAALEQRVATLNTMLVDATEKEIALEQERDALRGLTDLSVDEVWLYEKAIREVERLRATVRDVHVQMRTVLECQDHEGKLCEACVMGLETYIALTKPEGE